MRRGGFGAGALLSAVMGAMLSGAVNATDLSSMPVVSGTLTISAPGEYVVDGDVQCTTLAITAEGAVTFVNPSAGETNTIHVGSVTSVANASAAFNCKVAFDAAYNVAAEGPVTFAGGATATAPGTTSGAYGKGESLRHRCFWRERLARRGERGRRRIFQIRHSRQRRP